MFTFIRMSARSRLSAPSSRVEELKSTIDTTTLIRLAKIEPPKIQQGPGPWDKELRRLQKRQQHNPNVFEKKVDCPNRLYLEPLVSENPGPPGRQGTQTDLKIWWGKAVIPYTFDPRDAKLENDSPKRQPNPWGI